MYFGNRNTKKALLLTGMSAVVLIVFFVVLAIFLNRRTDQAIDMSTQTENGEESEAEAYVHMTVYQTSEGQVSYDAAALLTKDEQKEVYSVGAESTVALQVVPEEGNMIQGADINGQDGTILAYDMTEEGIRFQVPMEDVYVRIHYQSDPAWEAASLESDLGSDEGILPDLETEMGTESVTEPITEPVTEAVAEQAAVPLTEEQTGQTGTTEMPDKKEEPKAEELIRQGTEEETGDHLTLYGDWKEQTEGFGNPFSEDVFLEAISQAFSMGDPGSYYFSVKRVAFSEQRPPQEEGAVQRYVYLDEDPTWLILATYYPVSDTYLFEDTTGRSEQLTESQMETEEVFLSGNEGYEGNAGVYDMPQTQTQTVTTTLSLQNVSTVFLAFIEDAQGFSDQATSYIFQKGITGEVIGYFEGYEIDPETQKAAFTIQLSTGGSISGTFDKVTGSYSFSG